jgi:hypothetical protein
MYDRNWLATIDRTFAADGASSPWPGLPVRGASRLGRLYSRLLFGGVRSGTG